MADTSDLERNYPATPRRLEQARERGQVPRSRELAAAVSILAAAVAFGALGPGFYRRCATLVRQGLTLDREAALAPARMAEQLGALSADALMAALPLLAAVLAATVAAPLVLSGGVFSWSALRVDFARMNPARGLAQLFSSQGVVELVKALAKCALIGGVATAVVINGWDGMQALGVESARNAIPGFGGLMLDALFALALGLGAIAALDVPYQVWRHHDSLKMSREDLRQEQRETDGDPQQKGRIRNVQRALARKRMMAAVPKADVIVANPTHYAVALEYREGKMRAPRVVAKGVDEVALRIREIGRAHAVPVLEAPPLARALYRHAPLDKDIPPALFTAVAQVLAYVHQVQRFRRTGGTPPMPPTDLDVPRGLDPQAGSAAVA